jgi:hypothetical protein
LRKWTTARRQIAVGRERETVEIGKIKAAEEHLNSGGVIARRVDSKLAKH